MKFLCLWVVLLLGRVSQLAWLYFTEMPGGGNYVDRWYRFFPHSIVVELGVISVLVLLIYLLACLLKKHEKLVFGIGVTFSFLYLLLSGANDEMMRWMGQPLTLSFLKTYTNAMSDPHLVGRIFVGGLGHFLGSIFLMLLFTVLSYLVLFRLRFKEIKLFSKLIPILLLVLAVVGLSSPEWFGKSRMRFKRIAPFAWNFASEIGYNFSHFSVPENYAEGITFLGGNPSAEYPFYKKVENDSLQYQAFKERPLSEKPDIILLTIESFRGYTALVSEERICNLLPNICRLASQGILYSKTTSVGYPSIEGLLGIQVGIWSHPEKTLLSDRSSVSMLSLPDILGKAGYHRMVLTATEPSFDNLIPWFRKWFDYYEYDPKNQHDVPIANRFIELYRNRPKDKPLYFNWMSTTMHIPFSMPEGMEIESKEPYAKYERTLAYMDSAVGILLEEVAKSDRAENTIFILTGDHSTPTQAQNNHYGNGIHPGYIWVPLLIAGNGITPKLDTTNVASHTDIAPSILHLLNLNVSNHFPGNNLFKVDSSARFAFRLGDMVVMTDSANYYGNLEENYGVLETFLPLDSTKPIAEAFVGNSLKKLEDKALVSKMHAAIEAYEWVIDNNLLFPIK